MTTANCYLVHAAGNYKIPLVYGNAIKDGTANTVAYAPGGSNTDTYCANFVNHDNIAITGPWITKSGAGVDAGMGLNVTSAELLWQDASGLISAVGIEDNYLTFTIGTFNPGNALIAVKNGSGTILWSWHIWATDETLASTTAVNTGDGGHTYYVSPVNLGWVPTGGSGKQGYCPYYQWGRKDPFIPASSYDSNTNHTVYNVFGSTITGITFQESTTAIIADNIKNPTYFYRITDGNSRNCPVTTLYYNMWDAQNVSTNNITSATKKTIYDPCPPGFCVPTGNLYCCTGNGLSDPNSSLTMRSDSNWDSTNKGKTWILNGLTSIYFPAVGFRNVGSGNNPMLVGSYGYYWSATPASYNQTLSRHLNFYSSAWFWNQSARGYGCSIRPVGEE